MIARNAIDIAKDFIRRWEGLELDMYLDAAGLPTIGVGHLIRDDEDFSGGITEDEAMLILEADMTDAIECVDQYVDADLDDGQMAALISFAFNVGCGAFRGSTLLKMINAGNVDGASQQFARWNKAGGKVVTGLTRRREAERKLFDGVVV